MIDITKPETYKKAELPDLVADAVERNDEAALKWLETESGKMKERTRSDGTKYMVKKSISEIRPAYLKMFCGYKTKSSVSKENEKARKRKKEEDARKKMFADAFKKLQK